MLYSYILCKYKANLAKIIESEGTILITVADVTHFEPGHFGAASCQSIAQTGGVYDSFTLSVELKQRENKCRIEEGRALNRNEEVQIVSRL